MGGRSSARARRRARILDIAQPAVDYDSVDYYAHWALMHFLLDGHHKFQAAAEAGRPLQLLTLLSVDDSNARAEDVTRVPEVLARPREPRRAA